MSVDYGEASGVYDDYTEDHPSDIYCGVCGLDYPCSGPCDQTAIYSPPADYLDRNIRAACGDTTGGDE